MEVLGEKERVARVTIPVVGMTCAGCVGRVERALGGCRAYWRRA